MTDVILFLFFAFPVAIMLWGFAAAVTYGAYKWARGEWEDLF
jgi:hypothetical protein